MESFKRSSLEYRTEVGDMPRKEQERLGVFERMGRNSKMIVAGFLAMTAVAVGEGAMREAHGQVRSKGGSGVEDVFNKYSGEVKKVGQKNRSAMEDVSDRYSGEVERVGGQYQKEGERAEEKAGKEVDTYNKQRKITADYPSGTHVEIRQGYGGKKFEAPMQKQRHVESQEQIDELAMQALRILYDIPNRDLAKHLIKDFAEQIHQDVGDAAEILGANLPRLMNRLNNQPDGAFDSKASDAFIRSIKTRQGIQEVLDSARSKIAPRPKGAPPR